MGRRSDMGRRNSRSNRQGPVHAFVWDPDHRLLKGEYIDGQIVPLGCVVIEQDPPIPRSEFERLMLRNDDDL